MASSTDLQVVITAKDEASGVIGGLSKSIDDSKASILAIGAVAGAAFAGIVSEIKAATDAASEHQNAEAQLAAVLKSTGGSLDIVTASHEVLKKGTKMSTEQVDALKQSISTNEEKLRILNETTVKAAVTVDAHGKTIKAAHDHIEAHTVATDKHNLAVKQLTESIQKEKEKLGEANTMMTVSGGTTQHVTQMTAEAIDQLSASLEMTTGYSRDTTLQIDTLLVGFKDIGAKVMPAATKAILDFATRTGVDAVSAASSLGKALADPSKAAGVLLRDHVALTAAQKESIKSFMAVGDVASAQGVIVAALNDTYGGAAEQTNTLAFQQRLLSSQVTELQVAIGDALMPVITSLMAHIQPVIAGVIAWTKAHPELTRVVLLGGAAISGLVVAVTALSGAVLFFTAVSLPVVGTILAIVVVVGLLIAGFYELYKHWDDVTNFIKTSMPVIQKAFENMVSAVIGFFKPLIDLIDSIVSKIGAIGSGIGNVIKAVGGTISSAVHAIVPHAAGGSVNPFNTYLVGENGPELFTSNVGGQILPNSQLAGMGGGGGSINININGAVFSKDAANQLGAVIMQQLRMKTRIGV